MLRKPQGFTLLEVVIALALLAFLSYFTAQAIQKGVQAKGKIQDQIDRETELREAVGLIVRDLQRAFNYRDINIELNNRAVELRTQSPAGGPAPTPAPGSPVPTPTPVLNQAGGQSNFQKKEEVVVTQFIGIADRVDFSSLSLTRTSSEDRVSDQAEIGYKVDRCRSRINRDKSSQCLFRRVTPFIDENIQEGGTQTVLIENVESFQLRYMGPGFTEEWLRAWSSTGQENTNLKGVFPFAVEITLTILDTKFDPPRKLAMTSVAQLRFPNNPRPTGAAPNAPAE